MLKISDIPVISLDLETGGLIPGKHTPLAIGAVVVPGGGGGETYEIKDQNSFYIQLEWDTVVVDPQALRINKLNIANPPGPNGIMTNRSLPAHEGIGLFDGWLGRRQFTAPVYALGMNVGSFDLPMLRSVWQTMKSDLIPRPWPFHYRSIDLNSLFFALSQVQNKPYDVIKQEITKIAWEKSQFPKEMEHNALADAWFNVYAWKECVRRFNGDCINDSGSYMGTKVVIIIRNDKYAVDLFIAGDKSPNDRYFDTKQEAIKEAERIVAGLRLSSDALYICCD